jgi:hypothetical protein
MLSQGTNDWQFWTGLGATCLEVRHEGQVVGAAMVTAPSPYRLFEADSATVVESAARSGHASDTVLAAVKWCLQTGCPSVGLQVPGAHEALPRLLDLGFHISDVDMACASDEELLADPTRTTSFGEPLPVPEDYEDA